GKAIPGPLQVRVLKVRLPEDLAGLRVGRVSVPAPIREVDVAAVDNRRMRDRGCRRDRPGHTQACDIGAADGGLVTAVRVSEVESLGKSRLRGRRDRPGNRSLAGRRSWAGPCSGAG